MLQRYKKMISMSTPLLKRNGGHAEVCSGIDMKMRTSRTLPEEEGKEIFKHWANKALTELYISA